MRKTRRLPRRLIRILAAVSITAAAVVSLGTAANAGPAPPCYAGSCNGQVPWNGCGTPSSYNPIWVSPEVATNFDFTRLYFSPWCDSNWEVSQVGAGIDDLFVRNSTGTNYSYAATPDASYMIDGSTLNQACAYWHDVGWVCTNYH
jgi:hypothetical protein